MSKKYKKDYVVILLVVQTILLIFLLFQINSIEKKIDMVEIESEEVVEEERTAGNYDEFADCLTESGATFYGAYWCPHCNSQKEMFGASIDKVNYVECSLPERAGSTQDCIDAGVKSYPTWEFGDGSRQSGAIPLETLSQKSGCPLN